MSQKISVPVSFPWTLPSSNQLHGQVDKKRVRQRLEFQRPSFPGVMVIGLNAVDPDSRERGSQSANGDIRSVLVKLVVSPGKIVFDTVVRYEKKSTGP